MTGKTDVGRDRGRDERGETRRQKEGGAWKIGTMKRREMTG